MIGWGLSFLIVIIAVFFISLLSSIFMNHAEIIVPIFILLVILAVLSTWTIVVHSVIFGS